VDIEPVQVCKRKLYFEFKERSIKEDTSKLLNSLNEKLCKECIERTQGVCY
jgi:hypothetical protein